MAFGQTGNLYQQLPVTEWDLDIVVGAGGKPFQMCRVFFTQGTDQQHRRELSDSEHCRKRHGNPFRPE